MVYKREWTKKNGTKTKKWYTDIHYLHPDGSKERVRDPCPGTTRREAEHYERQVLAALMDGTYGTRAGEEIPTLKEHLEAWLEEEVKIHRKPSVYITSKSACEAHLIPQLGDKPLDKITSRDVSRLARALLPGRAPKTVNNILGVLSTALSCAVEWSLIDSTPKIKWLEVPPQDFEFLDFEETELFLLHVEKKWFNLMFFFIKTGLRLGEALALRWTDVHLDRKLMWIGRSTNRGHVTTPKNGQGRWIPLSDDCVEMLKNQRLLTGLLGGLVFCKADGSPLNRNNIKRVVPKALKAAGIKKPLQLHGLRHTYASHLASLGVPLYTIQVLLGHKRIEQTQRYAHLIPDSKHGAVALLDGSLKNVTIETQKKDAAL